ncbi:transporter substrate-binding domain-containing protein, partial [Paenibacillus sp. TAF58]
MKKQYLSAGMILLVSSLLFTACGTKETANKPFPSAAATKEAAKETAGQATQTLLDTIKANGKIRIGTEGTYAPFTYHDKDGKLTGFDVEIAQEIAKKMGVQAEFIETKWDGMFAGLDSKRFDIVVNEVTIKEDRKVKYDFSDPYIVSKAVL